MIISRNPNDLPVFIKTIIDTLTIIHPSFLDIWKVDSYIIFKTSRQDKNARY